MYDLKICIFVYGFYLDNCVEYEDNNFINLNYICKIVLKVYGN